MFQVCCVLPDKLPAYFGHQRLLEYSSDKDVNTKTRDRDSDKIPGQGRQQCGRQMTAAKRVVGGTDAAFGSFPWMALVKGGQSRCGGALIGDRSVNIVCTVLYIVCTDLTCHPPLPRWVVTAAHCVRNHASAWSPGFTVVLGEHTLLQNTEPLPRQKYRVTKVHMHPLYQQTPQVTHRSSITDTFRESS